MGHGAWGMGYGVWGSVYGVQGEGDIRYQMADIRFLILIDWSPFGREGIMQGISDI